MTFGKLTKLHLQPKNKLTKILGTVTDIYTKFKVFFQNIDVYFLEFGHSFFRRLCVMLTEDAYSSFWDLKNIQYWDKSFRILDFHDRFRFGFYNARDTSDMRLTPRRCNNRCNSTIHIRFLAYFDCTK